MDDNHSAFRWRKFFKGMGIAFLGFALLQGYDKLKTRSEMMEAIAKTEATTKMARPSIDLIAPAKTKTATFALG